MVSSPNLACHPRKDLWSRQAACCRQRRLLYSIIVATDKAEISSVLADLKQRLDALLGDELLRSVLFGSRARGDHTNSSDIDVALIVRNLTRETKKRILHEVGEVELDHLRPISLLTLSEEQFDHLLRRERLIAREIDREGAPL